MQALHGLFGGGYTHQVQTCKKELHSGVFDTLIETYDVSSPKRPDKVAGSSTEVPSPVVMRRELVLRNGKSLVWDVKANQVSFLSDGKVLKTFPHTSLSVSAGGAELKSKQQVQDVHADGSSSIQDMQHGLLRVDVDFNTLRWREKHTTKTWIPDEYTFDAKGTATAEQAYHAGGSGWDKKDGRVNVNLAATEVHWEDGAMVSQDDRTGRQLRVNPLLTPDDLG
ncbi:MAG TPA: hypothetical protein VGO93_22410 [Candidatus Xenobia bacterium]|jgi:hypothetical protein